MSMMASNARSRESPASAAPPHKVQIDLRCTGRADRHEDVMIDMRRGAHIAEVDKKPRKPQKLAHILAYQINPIWRNMR